MNGFLLDLRQGRRMLSKSPGFVFVAVLALGFGIAVNSAIFTLLNAVTLRPKLIPIVVEPLRTVTGSASTDSMTPG